MKVVILAGGKGTRISEFTKVLPKPMIKIGSKPIIEHIINYYFKFGFNDFIIAGGYKYKVIENYFKKKKFLSKKINVVNTGLETLTGSRLKKLSNELKETFMLTYGDGLSNINLRKLLKFHKNNKKKITLTAVHPPARFGELSIKKNTVSKFEEKPQLQKGWINGGFFVVEPEFLKLIGNKNVMLERSPLKKAVLTKNLAAYKHPGFWFCMDTLRDKKVLDDLIKFKKSPWLK
ncbi:sugar phosphate nucleotidyltransferase [Candidatus Pelagibacter sp. HIMB1587]|uniref:sugar phosphate nucleotidyltransferase n=1 Tax=Candidatus Pelagibacter sp. HIMB1587 TaxID=3413354 RepID=UPI003F835153